VPPAAPLYRPPRRFGRLARRSGESSARTPSAIADSFGPRFFRAPGSRSRAIEQSPLLSLVPNESLEQLSLPAESLPLSHPLSSS
jgi:hypothetical protein